MILFLDRMSRRLAQWFGWIGGIALIALTALACFNMLMRPLGKPLAGAYELIGFLGALVVAFSLGYAQLTRSHISVDILTARYSKRKRQIVHGINSFLCTIFFLLVAWQSARYATTVWKRGEMSETLRMVYHPFVYMVALCCLLLAFILLIDFLKTVLSPTAEDR
jgi:TRAP-type C4-dicarboxylate transport system permease small subunit